MSRTPSSSSSSSSLRPQTSAYGLVDIGGGAPAVAPAPLVNPVAVPLGPATTNPPVPHQRSESPLPITPNTGKRTLHPTQGRKRLKKAQKENNISWAARREFCPRPVKLVAPTDDALEMVLTMIRKGDPRFIEMRAELAQLTEAVADVLRAAAAAEVTDDDGDE